MGNFGQVGMENKKGQNPPVSMFDMSKLAVCMESAGENAELIPARRYRFEAGQSASDDTVHIFIFFLQGHPTACPVCGQHLLEGNVHVQQFYLIIIHVFL